MKHQRMIWACVALILGIWIVVRSQQPPPDPIHNGRSATEWFEDMGSSGREEAVGAFVSMGRDSVPFLVREYTRANTTLWREKVFCQFCRLIGKHAQPTTYNATRSGRAFLLLRALGPVAEPAVPKLLKSLNDPGFVDHGGIITLLGLIHSRPQKVVPVLARYAGQTNLTIKLPKEYFIHLAAIRALARFGTNANRAIPVLQRLLHSANAEERMLGATALLAANHSLEEALAIIRENLDRTGATWQLQLRELSWIGPLARPAVPLLREGLEDEDEKVRRLFESTLNQIADSTGG